MIVDEIFEVLAELFGATSPPAVEGRVTDQIGVPVEGASVSVEWSGAFSGRLAGSATTSATGSFQLGGPFPAEYTIVIRAGGVEHRIADTRRPPIALGEIRVVLPIVLTGSVGDGGDNRPRDLRRVQDWLHRLGRLDDADVAAEPVSLAAAPPLAPGPRLLGALAAHLAAYFGRRLPVTRVERTGPTAAALATVPPFPLTRLALATPVGELPGADAAMARNAPSSFVLVQARLHQLGLLTRARHVAEVTDGAAASPVDPATKPRTLEAIVDFERRMAGGSLRAIVPGALNERLLNDPFLFGRRPLVLGASVGERAPNAAADVRRVQDRLRDLGFLSDADHLAERAALPAVGEALRVADSAIPQTIAALRALRQSRLGEAAPAPGVVDPVDESLARLSTPARLELRDGVGWGPSIIAANRPADVRHLQDRLLLLGFLSQAHYDAEKADPYATERIDQAAVTRTAAAQALVSQQRGALPLGAAVGPGAPNLRADVRALQDRLHGLLFLAPADYQRERVDTALAGPAPEASLVSTFAAIGALRRRVFALPAAVAGQPWTAEPRVEPGDETHRFLADPLFFGRRPLPLAGSVGTDGWNFPADVRAVQERLREMRLLAEADFTAEAANPALPGRVANLAIPATRAAIRRLHQSLLLAPEPVPERIEARSAVLLALEDPLGALRAELELGDSVGWDGANLPEDVHRVQRRLHGLGFLDDAALDLELAAAPAQGESALRGSQISETIAAIGAWQQLMLGEVVVPRVDPLSRTCYSLRWPPLPRRVDMTLGDSVGTGGGNRRADVRIVQDRLFELGLLFAADHYRERADPAAGGTVPDASLVATRAAIGRLQQTLAGLAARAPDMLVSAGGRSARVLEDPAFGTPTAPNAACDLGAAGPERPVFASADLMRVILAIEREEGGVSSGEIPAILRNASGTPTSWGAAQVIGGTAVGTMADAANAAFAAFYGLDAATLGALVARRNATVALVDDITGAHAHATTEADLQAAITVYTAANAATVRATTGLGPTDIENIFRAAQLRRNLEGLAPGADVGPLLDAAAHPDSAVNIERLRLTRSEVQTYKNNPLFYGEHRQGFVTRALFLSPQGQVLRNALTDDSGFKIGRYVVRDNWDSTANRGLNPRQRAQLTAYLHNRGGDVAALAGDMATVAAYPYVVRVIARYDALP